jgi:hypothetical protein
MKASLINAQMMLDVEIYFINSEIVYVTTVPYEAIIIMAPVQCHYSQL